jgi:hypothetical protein
MLVPAPEKVHPLDGYVICVEILAQDVLDPGEDYLLAFQGGSSRGVEDDAKSTTFLTLDHPVRDPEHVPSMDLRTSE